MRYECYNCGERFNEKDVRDSLYSTVPRKVTFLTCPYCDSDNVEDLENELL